MNEEQSPTEESKWEPSDDDVKRAVEALGDAAINWDAYLDGCTWEDLARAVLSTIEPIREQAKAEVTKLP